MNDSDHEECNAQSAAVHFGAAHTAAATVMSMVDNVVGWAREEVTSRVPRADLDHRDSATSATGRPARVGPGLVYFRADADYTASHRIGPHS